MVAKMHNYAGYVGIIKLLTLVLYIMEYLLHMKENTGFKHMHTLLKVRQFTHV